MHKKLSPIEENRIAGIALGKTIVAIMYSVPIGMCTLPVQIWLEATDLSTALQSAIMLAIDISLLGVLIFAVIKGWLPGSKIEIPFPFSERQFVAAITILSIAAWPLSLTSNAGKYIITIGNAVLVLGVLVFFVTKSILSRRIRIWILSALAVPCVQLAIEIIS